MIVRHRPTFSLVLKLALGVVAMCSAIGGAFALQHARRAPTQPSQRPAATRQADDKLDHPVSDPYTGDLSIFEDPKRAEKLQIDRVMDILGIKEGAGVADIGAGSGWFTVRAAKRAGATGTVYAVEINDDYLKHIVERAAKEGFTNIRAIRGTENDPRLPVDSVDAVLLLKTYHEIAQPIRVLRNLRPALRPGARIGVIDRNGKGNDHGLDQAQVVKDAARAGYTLTEQYDFVKPDGMDYFLVFRAQR